MRIRMRIYDALVNRVPLIQEKYHRMHDGAKGSVRMLSWGYLLWLNVSVRLLPSHRKENKRDGGYHESKRLYFGGSESSLSMRESPENLGKRLMAYDVISFDVFDTLIFRPFSKPSDLFFLVAEKLGYLDFERIRGEMEWKAREKCFQKKGHYEVTLQEIYELLEEETGISGQEAMEAELLTERQCCFANPYMIQVTEYLRKNKKRLIVTSDMYLSQKQMKELLSACGFPDFDACYISGCMGASKNVGDLYELVKHAEGEEKSYVHVGDNEYSDVRMAKRHGWESVAYCNVNSVGMAFRAEDMSPLTGSMYRGVVNAHLHNGLMAYSQEYEFGFVYGGLFVLGYCAFIHSYVNREQADKILFLSRDGDVLRKAYQRLFPEEAEKCQYVYWSRLAAVKMTAARYKYDFFRRFLNHKVNQGYSLKQIFASMELEDMLAELVRRLGLSEGSLLTDRNVEQVKAYLMERWKWVLAHYEPQISAGKQYYEEVLLGCKKAVAVDIGWAGSGAMALDYLVNQRWGIGCEIIGILAGTNSSHNAEKDMSEPQLHSKKLVSYLFSQAHNRDLWRLHDPAKGHNLLWEMLLDAPHGSLKGFYPDKAGGYACVLKQQNQESRAGEIQKGILNFIELFHRRFQFYPAARSISGRDAYAPMALLQEEENRKAMKSLWKGVDETNI